MDEHNKTINDKKDKYYISASKITKKFDISAASLRRWGQDGKIEFIRTNDNKGKRLYNLKDVEQVIGIKTDSNLSRKTIGYARVSSNH